MFYIHNIISIYRLYVSSTNIVAKDRQTSEAPWLNLIILSIIEHAISPNISCSKVIYRRYMIACRSIPLFLYICDGNFQL